MSPQRQHGTGVSQLREALYDLPIHTVETLAAPPSTTCPVPNGRRPAKPGMEEKMGQALVERMGRDDVACNLAANSMVTDAYICGGGDKYKSWVVEYTQVGIERIRQNNGILPANLASRARSANISTASGMMVTVVEPRGTAGTI